MKNIKKMKNIKNLKNGHFKNGCFGTAVLGKTVLFWERPETMKKMKNTKSDDFTQTVWFFKI